MQIGLDAIPLTASKTGVGHYTFELASALARVKPESTFELLYPSTYDQIILTALDGERPPNNLRVARVRVGMVGRHWWSAGLPHYLRRRRLDLFHGTNYEVPLWRRCATVITVHDLSLQVFPETHERRRVRRSRRRLPLMTRQADAVIVPTESVRREVCQHLGLSSNKVFAVPEAARSCFRPIERPATESVRKKFGIGDNFLLSVGTLEPRKNLIMLVAAFEELARARRETTLQLVIAGGRGWLSEPILAAIEKSTVRKQIVLTEYLNNQELRALYGSCRAFVYPSIYEGFGLPPLEAMACGAPVVTSRIPSIQEVVGTAALLVDPKNKSEIVQNIGKLLDDDAAVSYFSQAGLRRSAEFTWAHTAHQTLAVYDEARSRFERDGE
jgi:glycosyltransferase involved in cell wall biosynthesis